MPEVKYGRGKHPNSRAGCFKKGHTVWLGRHLSEEHKEKLRLSKLGEKNPNWKNGLIGKGWLHRLVEKSRGKPNLCEHCGTINAKKFDWANKSHEYKHDMADWIRLCRKCHVAYDRK